MARKNRPGDLTGMDLPPHFRDLPAGRYAVEPDNEAPALLPDEEAGIEAAVESYGQGRAVDANRAREIIDAAAVSKPWSQGLAVKA